jgi:hypothetical protein
MAIRDSALLPLLLVSENAIPNFQEVLQHFIYMNINKCLPAKPIAKSKMNNYPWIRITHSKEKSTLNVDASAFSTLPSKPDSNPSFATLIGRRTKTQLLSQILGFPNDPSLLNYHSQVYLRTDTETEGADHPLTYIDCEIQHHSLSHSATSIAHDARSTSSTIEWLACNRSTKEIAAVLVAKVLAPLSDVVCYFASDLGGLRGVACLLADQTARPVQHDRPQAVLPRILVVAATSSATFDHVAATAKLRLYVSSTLINAENCGEEEAEEKIRAHFHSIQVLGLYDKSNRITRSSVLRERLLAICREVQGARRINGFLFSKIHTEAFSNCMLENFCELDSTFSFIYSSRPQGSTHKDFQLHLQELIGNIPSPRWLWHFVVPLTASALLLANYTRESHCNFIHLLIPFFTK